MKPFDCDRCGKEAKVGFAEFKDTHPNGKKKKMCRKCGESFIEWWNKGKKKQ